MIFKKTIKKYNHIKFYSQWINKNDLCFDIGANIGIKSKLLLALNTKVIAFEPQTICQSALMKIKEKNSNFRVKKLAIGSKNTELDLFIGNHIEIATLSNKFKDHFKSEDTFWNKKERVKVVTLNSQIEAYGLPHFCKIDAEGSEYDIIKVLSYKIPIIEFEFTGGFIEETLLCISKLNDLGDYTFNYILNEKPKFISNKWLTTEHLKSKIELMPTQNLHGNIFAKLNH